MEEFKDLEIKAWVIVIVNAKKWLSDHKFHVLRLVRSVDKAYSPSGSDLSHPELWKAAHWRWFLEDSKFSELRQVKCSDCKKICENRKARERGATVEGCFDQLI